ncbi:MAG: copper homeostasis protein CutC [Bacteroidetes bacterium]|nr:copper homeostasis protein CutC [Bacteroidota bacterium]
MIIEACVNSAVSAIEAQKGGADRVELCENLHDGGTTPSAGSIRFARKNLNISLFVMIRPRGGDFLYSEAEFNIMQEDIRVAKKTGADGVVFGILLPDGTVDVKRMNMLVKLARPMGITCHRAFDMAADPFRAMEDLIGTGIDRILTSGQQPSAIQGAGLIRDLILKSANRIIIMPGCGVKEHNAIQLIETTGAKEVHIHLDKQANSHMQFRQSSVYMGKPGQSEFDHPVADWERIKEFRLRIDGA